MNQPLSILHIVRRYGPVGGMERYVWELTHELAAAGHDVCVLCEACCADTRPGNVQVHELGEKISRPRWLGHLLFSKCVRDWLRAHPEPDRIIHSHERTGSHHVTTFHSPPFASIKDGPWWKQVSLRAQTNLWLEKREVCAPQVKAVVPNSAITTALLHDYYPCIGKRMSKPVTPGVTPGQKRPERSVPLNGGIIGFVGREWKRKGLDIAVSIVAELRKKRPDLELWVAGPEPEEIIRLFGEWTEGFRLLGRVSSCEIYPQLDLLLHPARQEPYGMVIAEAMATRVPVVISSRCGIAPEISPMHGHVANLTDNVTAWAAACNQWLEAVEPPAGYERSWQHVAREYEQLYMALR